MCNSGMMGSRKNLDRIKKRGAAANMSGSFFKKSEPSQGGAEKTTSPAPNSSKATKKPKKKTNINTGLRIGGQ
tara:strand:+ start:491 stop:709 length:219 start_codon:yes stop_codon:yes gene_type:complete